MNIAIVIDSLVGGGAEKVMLTLAEELTNMNHSVTLLSLANKIAYDLPKHVTVESLFPHKATKVDRFWQVTKSIKTLEKWFKKQKLEAGEFDLVLSNLDRSNNLLAQSNVKNVHFIIHNSVEAELARQKKLGPLAYWYLLKSKKRLSGKSLVCVSKGIEEEIKVGSVIKTEDIRTIYNPANLTDIKHKALIESDDIPNEPYIIHVGRLAKQKRHDILFSAFAKSAYTHKLALLCNKPEKAKRMAEPFGMSDRLILPGFQKNPYNWIKNADALVLSSDFEGLGMVLIEAIALGVPVVSTDCTHGPSEILTGELAQYLVPMRDPDALADAISRVLQDKPDVSQADILNKVSAEQVAKQYLQLAVN